MARRVSTSQIRSQLRQAQAKQRQAVAKYNAAVRNYNSAARRFNSEVKRATDTYNREVRAHNARVRSNQQRLRREISKMNSTPTTTRYVVYRESVHSLNRSFDRLEQRGVAGVSPEHEALFDLSEGEAANSVAVYNTLLAEPAEALDEDVSLLAESSIAHELAEVDPDLDARWRGALFALNPSNPDAARHFCTSSREILTTILEVEAPDDAVLAAIPNSQMAPDGRVSRRARIRYCLQRSGAHTQELEDFVEEDIQNVVTLFQEFNRGTHGKAGRFDLPQLAAIKSRVEDAIRFLHRVVR